MTEDGDNRPLANPRLLRASGLLGAGVWIALRFVPDAPDNMLDRALLLGLWVITPLALALLGARIRLPASGTQALGVLQPLGAAGATVALSVDRGPLLALGAAPWLGLGLLTAGLTLASAHRGSLHDGREGNGPWLDLAAVVFFAVGAAWLTASLLGLNPWDMDPLDVRLTAVHLHFAGLAAPVILARGTPVLRRHRSWQRAIALGLILGVVLAALGLHGPPGLAVAGGAVGGLALWTWAATVPKGLRSQFSNWPERVLLAVAAVSVLLSVPLAVASSGYELRGQSPLAMTTMLRLHGMANAHGFALCGLLAFTLPAMRRGSTAQKSS
jgi:hypothetical protein